MVNFLNSNQSDELVRAVFSFLNLSDLTHCRLVNQRLRALANSKELCAEDIYKVRAAYDLYIKKWLALQVNTNQLTALEASIIEKAQELSTIKRRRGYFLSKINLSKVLPRITTLLSRIFTSKSEITDQNKIQCELEELDLQKQELIVSSQILSNEVRFLLLIYNKEKSIYETLKKIRDTDEKIMSLFGGRKGFEALPEMDITHFEGDISNFILPKIMTVPIMTAPIMRGRDKEGHEFFIIRAKNKRSENLKYQTFFRQSGVGSWSDGGYPIIYFLGDMTDNGQLRMEIYDKLAELIKTQQYGRYILF